MIELILMGRMALVTTEIILCFVAAIVILNSKWAQHTMWVSIVVAALASTLMSVMYTMLIDGKDAPDWVKYLVDSILRIRR